MNYRTSVLEQDCHLSWNAVYSKGYEVAVIRSIKQVPAIWDDLAPAHDIFLQRPYLQVLENNPPDGMGFCYLIYRKEGKPIGIAACQIQHFNVDKSLKLKEKENEGSPCFFTVLGRYLKGLVASKVEFTTFVCGNILLTGEHAYHFTADTIPAPKAFELVDHSMDVAKGILNAEGSTINGYLLKDFFDQTRNNTFSKAHTNLNEFTIEPNMVLNMDPNWKSFDDYLASLSSKYRVRTRKAFKTAAPLQIQTFDEQKIYTHRHELYKLYKSVAENSGFNIINLNIDYLYALKKQFKDDFTLTAYLLDGEIIAFYTTILNGEELEAHFLGFDQEICRRYKVYLNILYDIIKIGIEKQVSKIVYARTALEIKSTVGAQPYEMYCYMRHANAFSNKFVSPLLEYLKPDHNGWIPRQPFKDREKYKY